MHDHWIAERMRHIESSGIRKVFELARSLKDPVNLSIGQPHFDVPEPIKAAAHAAIDRGDNSYTVTQGIPELRSKIQAAIRQRYHHANREVFVTSGTSGGLLLALCCTVNPGDEVIVFDPYFVMYPHLVTLAGGRTVYIDTYPDFAIDVDRVRAALTPRTKAILINSPANPTGVAYSRETLRDLALLAHERDILLLSDEIYSAFCYDSPCHSPAEFNEQVVVFDGFSKTYGMTGWRLGYAHGPKLLIEEMIKLQQFSFVCAPSMVQYAGIAALEVDTSAFTAAYRQKRDRLYEGLKDDFEIVKPGGAFYVFPKAPWGSGSDFVAEAIRNNLLIIPGNVFSRKDSHFRLSYAAADATIERGIDILKRLAQRPIPTSL
ncbi:MAG: aminotransferase class I/II-fold pyridoxal phosphate-dependent enzyme [Planctomycetota bacterium]|nr:MAG: aminotransferase class I/II-fold pyridoxal phosphate-dependent enzyme [Planctomycetota bacterium]